MKALLLAVFVFGFAGYLAITDNDEGSSYWERWHHTTVQAASANPVLKKVPSFDLQGPGGERFDYLTIWPKRKLPLSSHLGAGCGD